MDNHMEAAALYETMIEAAFPRSGPGNGVLQLAHFGQDAQERPKQTGASSGLKANVARRSSSPMSSSDGSGVTGAHILGECECTCIYIHTYIYVYVCAHFLQ